MRTLAKSGMAINLAIIVLQACVLGFQINRWNDIVGAVFSIVVSFVGYLPGVFGKNSEKWFIYFYGILLVSDLIFQSINLVLLICFQWVVIQFCIHMNVSVDITDYGGVACSDWWHFGYAEINYRDRALIVSILMATIIILRLIHIVINFALAKNQSGKPTIYMTRELIEDQF